MKTNKRNHQMVRLTRKGKARQDVTNIALASERWVRWEALRIRAQTIGEGDILRRAMGGEPVGHVVFDYLLWVVAISAIIVVLHRCGGATDATDRSPEARVVETWPWE